MKTLLGGFMQKALVAFASVLITGAVWAQGTVGFANIGNGVNTPFFDQQGIPLQGSNYVAQLYFWRTEGSDFDFRPVGDWFPFYSLTNHANGYFVGGTVTVPTWHPGDPVWVQVRAWQASGGQSFEQAAMAGAWTGQSKILFIPKTGDPTGGVPTVPAALIGLEYPGEPLVVQPPQSRAVFPGESTTLSVVASTGVAGFYQWYQQPSNRPDGLIPGATNATYTTPPVLANTTYWVAITNSAGSTLSAPATLTVLPAPPKLTLTLDAGLPVLTLSAAPGLAYRIDYRTNLTTAAWTPLVELSLTTSPFPFTDPAASNSPARFYRAVAP
jgi:hypothetical protein